MPWEITQDSRDRCEARRSRCANFGGISDRSEAVRTAARKLARLVRQRDLDQGALYPPLREIRRISLAIATAIATEAHDMGLARSKRSKSVRESIRTLMYQP